MGCTSSRVVVGVVLPSSMREMRLFSEENLTACLSSLKDGEAPFSDSTSVLDRASTSSSKFVSKKSKRGDSKSKSKVHPTVSATKSSYDGIASKGKYEVLVKPSGGGINRTHVVDSIPDELEAIHFGLTKRAKNPGRTHLEGVPKDCLARAEALVMVLHSNLRQKHLRFVQTFDMTEVEGCLPFDIPRQRVAQVLNFFNSIDTNKLGVVRWEDIQLIAEELDEDVAESVFFAEIFKLHHRGRPNSRGDEMTPLEFALNTLTFCLLDAEDLEQIAFNQLVGKEKSGTGQPAFDSRTIADRFPALESRKSSANHYNSSLGRAIKEMIVKGCGLGPEGALIDRDVFLRICDKTPVVLFPLQYMQKFFRDHCGGMSWWEKFAKETRKDLLSKRGEGGILYRIIDAHKKGLRKIYRRRSIVLDGKDEGSDDEEGTRRFRIFGSGRRASAEYSRQRGRVGSNQSPHRKAPVTAKTEDGKYHVRSGHSAMAADTRRRSAAAEASMDAVLGKSPKNKSPKRKPKSRSVTSRDGNVILRSTTVVYDSDSSDGSIARTHSALATAGTGTIATHSLHTMSSADIRTKRPHGHRIKSKRYNSTSSKRDSLPRSTTMSSSAIGRRRSQ